MKIRGNLAKRILVLVVSLFIIVHLPFGLGAETAREYLDQGQKSFDRGEYYQAIEILKKSLKINPDFIDAEFLLSWCYYQIGECEEALAHIQSAQKLDKNRFDLKNLEGNILICLGDLQKAREIFEIVLKNEPNNIESRFGLAELEITESQKYKAQAQLKEALKIAPQSKKALLKLAEINLQTGNHKQALQFIELALKYHFDDPEVHYVQALYYIDEKRPDRAIHFLQVALSINENYYKARELLAKLYFEKGEGKLAIQTVEKNFLSQKTDDLYSAYYLSGMFKKALDDFSGALDDFARALRVKYDDEVSRIFTETIAIAQLQPDDDLRKNLANFHKDEARLLMDKDYLSLALLENRRALMLNPGLLDARIAHAEIFRILGYKFKYFFMLAVLKQNYSETPAEVTDNLALNTKDVLSSLSYKWRDSLKQLQPSTPLIKVNDESFFDPYSVLRSQFSLQLFTARDQNTLFHYGAEEVLLKYIQDIFSRHDQFDIRKSAVVDNQEDVFSESRKNKSDYFLVFRINEEERSFSLIADLYLSATGRLIQSFDSFRTGNWRIRNGTDTLVNKIIKTFPLKGMLLARSFNRALANLGLRDNVRENDVFLIIKKNKLMPNKSELGFDYAPDTVVGELLIQRVDETLSEGKIQKYGFFDFINPYDELVLKPAKDTG